MRSTKWILLPAALLLASAWVVEPAAQNTNSKARTKRPSNAIGAGGAGTYARGTRRKAPTAAPTPRAPAANTSFIGGSDDGTGIRSKGAPGGPGSQLPANVNVNRNANANTSFLGGTDEGTGIRRRPPRKRRP